MKFEIYGRPEFLFPLSVEEADLLIELSRNHYDGVCQSASLDGHRDSFLLGWRAIAEHNLRHDDEGARIKMTATWRQLDTTLKILEGLMFLSDNQAAKRSIGIRLTLAFYGAMNTARDFGKNWQAEYESSAVAASNQLMRIAKKCS